MGDLWAAVPLTNDTDQVHEELIGPVAVKAVLRAADEWVCAQEALVAAKQVSEETEREQEAVEIAQVRLVVAVTRWRKTTG